MRGPHQPSTPVPGLPNATLGDFWSWAYGNLLENTVRPAFAEFIVGVLLGVSSTGRKGWDAYDLLWQGIKIEVKSSAYAQAWTVSGRGRSSPRFDIGPKTPWFAETNTYGPEPGRSADCYVFCLYPEQDEAKANPLDVIAWRFWVLSTARIEAIFGNQKTVALGRIQALAEAVTSENLAAAINEALAWHPNLQNPASSER